MTDPRDPEHDAQHDNPPDDGFASCDGAGARGSQEAASAPYAPYPPYAPYAPFPPYPPYPPYSPYPPQPCAPSATMPCAGLSGPQREGDHDTDDGAGRHDDAGRSGTDQPPPPEEDGPFGDGSSQDPTDHVPPDTPPDGPSPDGHDTPHGAPFNPDVSVRRPDDLLVLDIHFVGLTFHADPPRLERTAADAFAVFTFPPQSFGEEAFLQAAPNQDNGAGTGERLEVTSHPGYPDKNKPGTTDANLPKQLPLSRIRMSGRSRIAVTMPADRQAVGYDLPSLLAALRDWPMRLNVNAVPDTLQGLEGIDRLRALTEVPVWRELLRDVALQAASATMAAAAEPSASSSTGVSATTSAASQAIAFAPLLPFLIGPHEPGPATTALELPYRLVTSPIGKARWAHSQAPVEHLGRTELWHTRLTTSELNAGVDAAARVRALWSPDYRPQQKMQELIDLITVQPEPPTGPQPNPNLIRMSLDPVDRSMLVTLMTGFDATPSKGKTFEPRSSEAKRLHLSALGALLDAEGQWTELPADIDLTQWRHLATLGRDHYVRVMYVGYLCPLRHAAALVKVTERRFQSLGAGTSRRVAVLRQRFFVVVREPVRTYPDRHHVHHGNDFPFTRVEILTRVTPDLAEPGMGASALKAAGADPYAGLVPRMLFWPMVPASNSVGMADAFFEIATTDIAGRRSTFSMPLLFVGKVADDKNAAALKAAYNASPAAQKRRAALGGALVSYAPMQAGDKGDPQLPTQSITFRAGDLAPVGQPNYHPEVEVAEVGIKPVQKLLGQADFISEVAYPEVYAKNGYSASTNAGQIFLQFTSAKPLSFGGAPAQAKSDALGALASPQMNLLGLSRLTGPIGGKAAAGVDQVTDALKGAMGGGFDPKAFFDQAVILGGVTLGDIVKPALSLAGDDVPKLLSRDFPDRLEASFDWSSEVTAGNPLLVPRADPAKPATLLEMHSLVVTPFDRTKPATSEATATLENFKINLFGFVILWFERLVFVSKTGQKPDVTVELRDGEDAVQFGGPLEFVNTLRKYIPSNGFSDPPALTVSPSGISASYSLTLPAVEVGVFALSNLSLGAGFNLPFDSRPASVRFDFSKRERPFSLTVSLLGGGGFFAIGVSAKGVNEIEAAIEFGAVVAINLGVASGSVEVKAGIYFHWLEVIPGKGSVDLAGYVRIHGELSVLAIISVSLTFTLQLGFHKESGQASVYGEATLVVEIEILMFSASVSVTCRKEFSGGAADPRFIALVPTQSTWDAYCDAFAEETV